MLRIGLGITLHEEGALNHIQSPIIGLALASIFNSHLKALVAASPPISTRIVPTQVRRIDEKGTDLTRFDRGLMRR